MILVIAEMAMSGVYPEQGRWIEKEKRRHLITPELTAQGSSEKVWLQENGKLALYKTSKYCGRDPLVSIKEAMVSDILDCINVPHVHYDLVEKRKSTYITKYALLNNDIYSIADAESVDSYTTRTQNQDVFKFAEELNPSLYYKTIVITYPLTNHSSSPIMQP